MIKIDEMSEWDILDNLSQLTYKLGILYKEIESPYDSKDELIEARVILKAVEIAKVLKVIL